MTRFFASLMAGVRDARQQAARKVRWERPNTVLPMVGERDVAKKAAREVPKPALCSASNMAAEKGCVLLFFLLSLPGSLLKTFIP